MRVEIAVLIATVIATLIVSAVVGFIIAVDSFTDDERNQLPRCNTATEVLVGSGNFYGGQWATYNCIDISTLE